MVRDRFVALDGMRGVAAVSVVMLHLNLFPAGMSNFAVDLFFIMSGFVIAAAYGERLDRLGWREFMRRRLMRLYPTYGLGLAIAVGFAIFIWLIASKPYDLTPYLVSLPFQALYLPTPRPYIVGDHSFFLLNGPGWSLLWELVINLLFAIFYRRCTPAVLATIVALSAAALMGFWLTGVPMTGGSAWTTWFVGPVRVAFGFPLGVLLYGLPRPRFTTPFWVLCGIFLGSCFVPGPITLFVLMPLLVWLGSSAVGTDRLLVSLGDISYPLYAIHMPLFGPLGWIGGHAHLSGAALAIFQLLSVCAASYFVLRYWDEPVRGYLAARRRRHQIEHSPVAEAR